MTTKRITAAEARKLTDKQLRDEQEKIERERQELREHGRVLKSEVDRRNMEGTIMHKIRTGKDFKEVEVKYLQALSKKDTDDLTKRATGDPKSKIDAAVKSSGSKKKK